MFGSIGMPELIIFLIATVSWMIPVTVAVWGILTLRRIRVSQEAAEFRLAAIEQLLQQRR